LDRFRSTPLRLDYMGLKKRLGGVPSRPRKITKPAFVELIAPHPATLEECVIEFASCSGAKGLPRNNCSIFVGAAGLCALESAPAPRDWTGLLRAWRETDR